jgi:hypothetical protein
MRLVLYIWRDPRVIFGILVGLGTWLMGCTPSVGSSCQLSTDCGSTGQLVCDTAQVGGYCTVVDCLGNTCPDNAGCINFYPSVPGCGYSDNHPSRLSQSFCMATCTSNSDCRDGYVCAGPTESPWFAGILDNNQQELVCLALPPTSPVGGVAHPDINPDAAVCQLTGPTFDAGFTPVPDAAEESLGDAAGDVAGKGD